MISFTPGLEDVLLWRALAPRVHHSVGFWIDAGAYDPVEASVTKTFSDHNWRGINIEPMPHHYASLVAQRPNDINLQAIVSDKEGSQTFFEMDSGQLSTTNAEYMQRHRDEGREIKSYEVKATTLAKVCEEHAPEQIHFLKIDVEGHEEQAIRGMDFNLYRPWILVLEATEPNRMDRPTHGEWEHMISAAGYQHVHTRLPNRYYVANEHSELKPFFYQPVDDYQRYSDLLRIGQLEREVHRLRQRLAAAT